MTRKQFVAAAASFSVSGQTTLTSVVFLGFPARRSKNEMGGNETTLVTGKDRDEYVCIVSEKAGQYFWTSRDNKPMRRTVSGAFVVYTALDGAGYVKCSNAAPDSPLDYMEHLHIHFNTLTYWGKSSIQRD